MYQRIFPLSEPREGLPPCLSVVMFDGRGASMRASDNCAGEHGGGRFWVASGRIIPCDCPAGVHAGTHSEITWHYARPYGPDTETNDPDEAQAAFDKGAEWVRTGVMP